MKSENAEIFATEMWQFQKTPLCELQGNLSIG